MDRYAFVLGKNQPLSCAEIICYLRKKGIVFNLQDRGAGFLVLDIETPISVEDLGGTIKIARVLSSSPGKTVQDEAIDEAASMLPRKCEFGVSSHGTGWRDVANRIKSAAASQGKSCKFMDIPRGRSSLTHVEVIKKGFVDQSAEFLALSGRRAHLASTVGVHDPFGFKERDMDRPFKRPMLSIPPRLARIMVNLSGQDGGILLDPFCGIGTILQEAALMGFTTWGTDTDGNVIPWARRNMKWLLRKYGIDSPGYDERIQRGDARKLTELFPANSLDAIVTEPDLGPALKSRADANKARRILRRLAPLYERFIRGSAAVLRPGGRLVVVSPLFDMGEGRPPMRLNMEAIASRTGLRMIDPFKGSGLGHSLPLTDSEERHRTIREITVLAP